MEQDERIHPFFRRFSEPAVEREFGSFVFKANLATNRLGARAGVPLFLLYGFLDFNNLQNPIEAVTARAAAAAICVLLLLGMYHRTLSNYHESLSALIVAVLGSAMIYIIWREPSLDNAYYIGLIQAGVFLTFVSRMAVFKAFSALAWILALFGVAVAGKSQSDQALLQFFILLTMFAIFGFGIVVSDTLRRKDFLKSRTIAQQNAQLNQMLADVREDNARKVAAMNLLVHFVKTPIHQIVGFSDVIKRRLERPETAEGHDETLQSAAFIQSASRDLSRSVSKLLSYYRLDEKAAAAPDLIELDSLILDHLERLSSPPPTVRTEKVAIVNRSGVVGDLIQTMIERYVDDHEASGLAEVRLERIESAATLVFADGGPALSDEDFARLTKPLDKLDHYLTANGSTMLLGLRTVARAAELCGGALTHRREGPRNVYVVALPDLAPLAAMNAPKVA